MYRLCSIIALTLGLLASPTLGQPTIFVDQSATGAGDGSSWADAFTDLQDALSVAASGDEIAVAEGTYTPSSTGDREESFVIPSRVNIFGGFPTGGGTPMQRDPDLFETVLSGDLAGNDGPDFVGNDENSFHVVRMTDVTDCTRDQPEVTVVFDGFTIRGGNAVGGAGGGLLYRSTIDGESCVIRLSQLVFAGNSADEGGAADFSSSTFVFERPVLEDVVFAGNRASGMGNQDGGGAVRASSGVLFQLSFIDVVFLGNTASRNGGAAYLNGGFSEGEPAPSFTNVHFYGNSADTGGAVYIRGGGGIQPLFVNALFSGNEANGINGIGGGVYLDVPGSGGVRASFSNVTFYGNSASDGGGVAANGNTIDSSTQSFYDNVIFWDNEAERGPGVFLSDRGAEGTFRSSLVQGVETGQGIREGEIVNEGGNFVADPLFTDADGPDGIAGTLDDDLTLLAASPAVDEGNQTMLPDDTADLDGDGNTNEPLSLDFAGNPRVDGLGVDIGAFERVSDGLEARAGAMGEPVTIAAEGGTLSYNLRLANEGAAAQAVDAWVVALLPNGNVFGPVDGPRAITLPAGANVGPVMLQGNVPARAPEGDYTALVRLGTFPDVVVAQAAVGFEKLAAAARGGAMTLADWQTGSLDALAAAASSAADVEASSTTLPDKVALAPAYPNPFARRATVGFALPEAAAVRLAVYDVLGRTVAVLADSEMEAGRHAASFDATDLAAGVYLVRLEAGEQVRTQQITRLR
ncbi:MAG: T9SS type A sorting domain-containing protein [Bacteroidota bacterium]